MSLHGFLIPAQPSGWYWQEVRDPRLHPGCCDLMSGVSLCISKGHPAVDHHGHIQDINWHKLALTPCPLQTFSTHTHTQSRPRQTARCYKVKAKGTCLCSHAACGVLARGRERYRRCALVSAWAHCQLGLTCQPYVQLSTRKRGEERGRGEGATVS